jgi:hypothetical protein
MKVTVGSTALDYIKQRGGRAAVDLICVSSWGGSHAEVSVDTNVERRRDISTYQPVFRDGVELLVAPGLMKQVSRLSVELKGFWIFRNLKAIIQIADGQEIGGRAA